MKSALKWLIGAGLLGCAWTAAAGTFEQWLDEALDHPGVLAGEQRDHAAALGQDAAARAYWGSGGFAAESLHYDDQRFVGVLTPQAFADLPFARDITVYGLHYALPVDVFGVIAASRRAAGADRDGAELALRQQRLLNLHAVTTQYAQLVALRRQAATLEIHGNRIGQTLERVQRQLDNGDASIIDQRLAEAEQARIAAERERLAAAQQQTLAALAAAVGHPVDDPGSPLPPLPEWPAQAPGDSALPVAQASAQAEGLAARAAQSRRELYPRLAAVAEYSRFESSADVPEAWGVGARLSLPIDPAGWRRSSALQTQADAARSDVEAAQRELARQWSALAATYRTARAESTAIDAERAALEEVVHQRSELHRVGMASLEELLRQQRDLREADARLAQAQAQALSAWSAAAVLQGLEPAAYRAALADR